MTLHQPLEAEAPLPPVLLRWCEVPEASDPLAAVLHPEKSTPRSMRTCKTVAVSKCFMRFSTLLRFLLCSFIVLLTFLCSSFSRL